MSRNTKLSLAIGVICLVIGGLVVLLNPVWPYQRRYIDESTRFRQLGLVAAEMVRDRSPGVVTGNDGRPYIESFSVFFAYVQTKHPEWASKVDDANPFPGLLPGHAYVSAPGKVLSADDLIFWSKTEHDMNVGTIRMQLSAGGVVDAMTYPR